jgi:hypothetical protein
MAATTTTRSRPAITRGEAGTGLEPAVPTEEAAAQAGSGMLQTMSRTIYSGSYGLAYCVVYAVVFVAQLLPQENPVMYGFRDGGRAAMDELGRG